MDGEIDRRGEEYGNITLESHQHRGNGIDHFNNNQYILLIKGNSYIEFLHKGDVAVVGLENIVVLTSKRWQKARLELKR